MVRSILECLNRQDKHYDEFTGILNKKGLENKLKKLVERECRSFYRSQRSSETIFSKYTKEPADSEKREYKKKISIITYDLDDFKYINDTYGHQRGDFIIKEFARSLKEISKREEDLIGEIKKETGRCGGEEFLQILYGATIPSAKNIADDLKNNNTIFINQEATEYITFSGGISEIDITKICKEFQDKDKTTKENKKQIEKRIEQEITDAMERSDSAGTLAKIIGKDITIPYCEKIDDIKEIHLETITSMRYLRDAIKKYATDQNNRYANNLPSDSAQETVSKFTQEYLSENTFYNKMTNQQKDIIFGALVGKLTSFEDSRNDLQCANVLMRSIIELEVPDIRNRISQENRSYSHEETEKTMEDIHTSLMPLSSLYQHSKRTYERISNPLSPSKSNYVSDSTLNSKNQEIIKKYRDRVHKQLSSEKGILNKNKTPTYRSLV